VWPKRHALLISHDFCAAETWLADGDDDAVTFAIGNISGRKARLRKMNLKNAGGVNHGRQQLGSDVAIAQSLVTSGAATWQFTDATNAASRRLHANWACIRFARM